MKLLRMQATFGKLDGAILELRDGLNVIVAPNEAGKSTWCAFLLAMLYGVDTAQRSSRDTIAVKTLYQPWSGKPMAGRLDLEWKGRRITIERTSVGKVPLGKFKAYETDSGVPVPELTPQNCGQMLTGANRAVFARSAFLQQDDHAVSFDQTLEQRLQELVTTGEEGVTFHQAEKQLQQLQNRCRYHKTGLIPEAEERLAALDETLAQMESLETQIRQVSQTLETQKERDQQNYDALTAQNQAALAEAQALEARCQDTYRQLQQELQDLPAEETLQDWQNALQQGIEDSKPPEAPLPPRALQGLSAPEAAVTARRDNEQAQALETGKAPCLWSRFLPLLLLIAAAALRQNLAAVLVCGGLGIGLTVVLLLTWLGQNKRYQAQQAQLQDLLERYQAGDAEDVMRQAREYLQQFRIYQERLQKTDAARQRLQTRLLTEISAYRPVTLLPEAIAAVQQALLDRMRLQNAVDQYQTAKQHAAQLQAAMELSSSRQASGDTLELTQTLSRLRGKLEALGDRAAVETQREALSERLGLLRRHYDAAQIALDALQQARDTLQARFAPPLRRLTAQYLAQLTGGAHCQISIDRQMQLELQDEKDPASHPSGYYSGGTRDQIYLALRLVIAELLLEPDVPYILDDALVCFDEQRLAYALEFLQQQAARRQILLFSCQTREQNYLRKEPI